MAKYSSRRVFCKEFRSGPLPLRRHGLTHRLARPPPRPSPTRVSSSPASLPPSTRVRSRAVVARPDAFVPRPRSSLATRVRRLRARRREILVGAQIHHHSNHHSHRVVFVVVVVHATRRTRRDVRPRVHARRASSSDRRRRRPVSARPPRTTTPCDRSASRTSDES